MEEYQEEQFGEHLTKREMEVLLLIADYNLDKEISQMLGIELSTTKRHVHNILSKLNVQNRREAAKLAIEKGLIIFSEEFFVPWFEASPMGWEKLSRREREIALLVAETRTAGLTAKELGKNVSKRSIKESTVKKHFQNIYKKLGTPNRPSTVTIAVIANREIKEHKNLSAKKRKLRKDKGTAYIQAEDNK